jgi:hypothetical protein
MALRAPADQAPSAGVDGAQLTRFNGAMRIVTGKTAREISPREFAAVRHR